MIALLHKRMGGGWGIYPMLDSPLVHWSSLDYLDIEVALDVHFKAMYFFSKSA